MLRPLIERWGILESHMPGGHMASQNANLPRQQRHIYSSPAPAQRAQQCPWPPPPRCPRPGRRPPVRQRSPSTHAQQHGRRVCHRTCKHKDCEVCRQAAAPCIHFDAQQLCNRLQKSSAHQRAQRVQGARRQLRQLCSPARAHAVIPAERAGTLGREAVQISRTPLTRQSGAPRGAFGAAAAAAAAYVKRSPPQAGCRADVVPAAAQGARPAMVVRLAQRVDVGATAGTPGQVGRPAGDGGSRGGAGGAFWACQRLRHQAQRQAAILLQRGCGRWGAGEGAGWAAVACCVQTAHAIEKVLAC